MATKVITVRRRPREALEVAAARATEEAANAPNCERVLVVYRSSTARVYVETAPGRALPRKRNAR